MKAIGVVFLLGFVCSPAVYPQAVIGSSAVIGTVRDYTGTGIPDTTVTVLNEKSGFRRVMNTTDDGTFNSAALLPDAGYTLKITRKGFQEVDYKDFELPAGHTLNFNISMAQNPGESSEVQRAAITVEDATGGLQYTVPVTEMVTLPTKNRDVNTLADLSPATVRNDESGVLAFRSVPSTNAYWTDGILTTNTYYFDKPPVAPSAPQEAVQEMQVVPVGAPTEFTHAMGGTVNVVTRSGGDVIHGDLYGYYNSNGWNASDRYAPGFSPSGSQKQFGLSAGGPMIKSDKIFWFFNVENLERNSQGLNLVFNPLITNPFGTAVAAANCTATAAQCTAATSFLNSQLNHAVDNSMHSLTGLAKVDWRLNNSNNFSFEADALQRHAPNGLDNDTVASQGGLLGANGNYTEESRYAKAAYTAVWGGNVVNEIRGGWYHDRFSAFANNQLPSTGSVGIDIAGSSFGGNSTLPMVVSEQRYQIVDNYSASLGPHLFRLGVDFSTNEDWNRQIVGSTGSYFFPTLTAFASDYSGNTAGHKDYTVFTQGFGQPITDLHTKTFAVYGQDTWTFRRLTAILGIVWEKTIIPQPQYSNSIYFQTGSISSPDINFAPRMGLAYRINDRTVVRASIGAYYQPFTGQLLQSLYNGNGISQISAIITTSPNTSPIFPRVLTLANIPSGSDILTYGVDKLRSPIAANGTVLIERRLRRDMTISAGYLYSRGISLWSGTDVNTVTPTVTKTYTVDDSTGSYATSIFTAKSTNSYAHVFEVSNAGSSSYNGVSVQFTKQMSHGITAQASYTWSRIRDDVSGSPQVAGFIGSSSTPGDYTDDRGVGSYNQPNRFVVNWTWQPVFVKNDSAAARFLINGWQLSGIGTFSSGLPETPVVIVNGQQFTGTTMLYPTSLNGSGGWTRVPFDPINNLQTGPEYSVDLRITRPLPFTERIKAMLMFEGFNAFNTQYNTSVNTIAYLATAGVLRPVSGLGAGTGASGFPWGDNARHLQIALKIVF